MHFSKWKMSIGGPPQITLRLPAAVERPPLGSCLSRNPRPRGGRCPAPKRMLWRHRPLGSRLNPLDVPSSEPVPFLSPHCGAASPSPELSAPVSVSCCCCCCWDARADWRPCQVLSHYTEQADGSFLISPHLAGKSELSALNSESCQGDHPWGGRCCQGEGQRAPQSPNPLVGSSPGRQQGIWPMGSFALGKHEGGIKVSGKTCCRWVSLIPAENSSPSLEQSFLNHSSFIKQISSCASMSKNHI